ncbi:MAG: tetratricopeptide repeat protein, partial [Planctomycetota bacterium]
MEFSKGWLVTLLAVLLTLSIGTRRGFTQSTDDESDAVAEKYLEVLLSRPRVGTAVARVYTHHLQNDSLDELFARLQTDGDSEADGRRRMVLGLIESHRGNHEQAIPHFEAATERLPDNALASFYLGQAHAALGHTDAATQSMRAAIDCGPARADALEIFTTLGQFLSQRGRKDDALKVWEQMEEHFPNDRRIGGRIAKALAGDQRFQLARDRYLALAASTKLDSERIQFQIEAAEMLRNDGERDDANAEFEAILKKLRPGSWLHEDVVARIEAGYLASNDYSGLADYYEQALEKQEDIASRIRLGRIRILEGNLAKARSAFETAIRLAPNDASVRLALIDLLQQSFDYAAAASQLKILAKQDPGNPDYILRWGKMLLEASETPLEVRRKEAAEIWNQLAEANPDDAVKLALVADQMRSINYSEDAIELYRKAIDASQEDPQFREYLGEYLMSLGRTKEAVKTWESIAATPRRNRQSLVRLAEIYGVFKMPEQAIATWTEAAEFDLTIDERIRFAVKLRESAKFARAFEQLKLAAAVTESDEEAERVFLAELDTHVEAGSLRTHIADFASSQPTAGNLRKLAVMWRVAEELDEAKRAIERAEKLAPDDIDILTASVQIADEQGRIGAAAEKLKRLAKRDRRFRPNHLKRLADLQIKLGRFDESLETCRDLIAATPASAESYSFLAKVAFKAQKDEQAIDALRQALRIAPRDNLARRRLAHALGERYRTEETIELYFEAIRLESNHDERVSLVALLTPLYQRQNKLDRLFPRLETLGREIGDPRVASLLIAQAHETSGNVPEARKRIENLLLSQPYDTRLLEEAVRLSVVARQKDDAVTYQQRLAEIASTPSNEARLIDLKVAAGQLSIQDAFRIQMDSVSDAGILAAIARKVIDRNDHAKTVVICRKLLAQNPGYWDVQFHLARALTLQARSAGQPASAEGMRLLRDLMRQRIPLDTSPPLFVSSKST